MKRVIGIFTLAGLALLAFLISENRAQDEPELIPATPEVAAPACGAAECCNGCKRSQHNVGDMAVDRWIHGRPCPHCGGLHGIANGRLRTAALNARHSIATFAYSGQPLIDHGMRADWIAQQRASIRSWHAGYYNTQYGAPLALVVPPTVRAHTRYGWGVAQSSVHPLYHQFKRPYPGPVAGAEYGGEGLPLRPTPRWPSHTDQFGVYYVRGPW
jgi:hypothetical protein